MPKSSIVRDESSVPAHTPTYEVSIDTSATITNISTNVPGRNKSVEEKNVAHPLVGAGASTDPLIKGRDVHADTPYGKELAAGVNQFPVTMDVGYLHNSTKNGVDQVDALGIAKDSTVGVHENHSTVIPHTNGGQVYASCDIDCQVAEFPANAPTCQVHQSSSHKSVNCQVLGPTCQSNVSFPSETSNTCAAVHQSNPQSQSNSPETSNTCVAASYQATVHSQTSLPVLVEIPEQSSIVADIQHVAQFFEDVAADIHVPKDSNSTRKEVVSDREVSISIKAIGSDNPMDSFANLATELANTTGIAYLISGISSMAVTSAASVLVDKLMSNQIKRPIDASIQPPETFQPQENTEFVQIEDCVTGSDDDKDHRMSTLSGLASIAATPTTSSLNSPRILIQKENVAKPPMFQGMFSKSYTQKLES